MQVLARVGSVEEMRIVELGAGIGRFTGALAATARSVTAVDFMGHLIDENKKTNGHRCACTCNTCSTGRQLSGYHSTSVSAQ